MTNLTEYGKGCSPSAIQREDGVTYEPGGELAEKLEHKIARLKELLNECQGSIATLLSKRITEVNGIKQEKLLAKISQVLGEE